MLLGLHILASALLMPELISSNVDCRLRARLSDPHTAICRFVNYPRQPFRLNPNFWAKDVDFSCVSPWNDSSGVLRAGTAISHRHVIFAKHYPLWAGVRMVFVDKEGQSCACTVKKTQMIDGSDIGIGMLDYELPPNIRPAKILPEDFYDHLGRGGGLPVVTFNRREELGVSNLGWFDTNLVVKGCFSFAPKKDKLRMAFHRDLVTGDSGNPAFLIVGKEAVLIYCLKSGGGGGGPLVNRRRREIQKAMDELCPGYKLEEFDFTKVRCGDGK